MKGGRKYASTAAKLQVLKKLCVIFVVILIYIFNQDGTKIKGLNYIVKVFVISFGISKILNDNLKIIFKLRVP